MSISFIDATLEQASGGVANADRPAGTVEDDIVFGLVFSAGIATPTVPAGWTHLSTQNWLNSGNTLYNHVYWKLLGGSEPSTYEFEDVQFVTLVAYRGADQSTPIGDFTSESVEAGVGGSPDITFSSITATEDGSRIVALISADNVNAFFTWMGEGLPPGFVQRKQLFGEFAADKSLSVAGATGSVTFSTNLSGTPTNNGKGGVMLILQPAGVEAPAGLKEYCNSIDAELN